MWIMVPYLSLSIAGSPRALSGQASTQVAFAPGGQALFVADLASARAGALPRGIQVLSGNFDVVSRNGTMMLRVAERSEFLITLPNDQRLPQDFTIEVDLVPKSTGPEPDLTLEGTRSINQGDASAHLQFLGDASFGFFQIVGGQATVPELPIPDPIRLTLPETFTMVGVSVEGSTIRFYVNGTEILPDSLQPARKVQARFARGNVLRVTLGGQSEGSVTQPVYLARLRVATGAPLTVATGIPAASTGTIRGVGANTVTGILARVGPQGDASVSWSALAGANSYFVVRWKVDDATCCNNVSPPAGMNRLDWADGVLPVAGTYAYRVYATTPSGIVAGEATLDYQVAAPVPTPGPGKNTGSTMPAPRTIDISQVTGAGGAVAPAPAASRTIPVPLIQAQGAGSGGVIVAPRAIAVAGVAATGPIRTNLRLATPQPSPRTVTMPAVSAVGGSALSAIPPVPRTIALPALVSTGGTTLTLVPPRTIRLPAVSGTGPARTR